LNHRSSKEIAMKKSIVVIALVVLSTSLAQAHAQLSSSVPADHASVQSPPQNLALHFTEAVRLTALSIARDGDEPKQVASLPAVVTKDFSVTAPALEAGHYSVSWRALSADSHVMTGTFAFTVGSAGAPAAASHEHAGHPRR
jgi:methionine-rich copper-binding protein CopC